MVIYTSFIILLYLFTRNYFRYGFFNDFFKVYLQYFPYWYIFSIYKVSFIKPSFQNFYKRYLIFVYLFCNKFFADAFNSFYIFLPTATFSLKITYEWLIKAFLNFMDLQVLFFYWIISSRLAYMKQQLSLSFIIICYFCNRFYYYALYSFNLLLLIFSTISVYFVLNNI